MQSIWKSPALLPRSSPASSTHLVLLACQLGGTWLLARHRAPRRHAQHRAAEVAQQRPRGGGVPVQRQQPPRRLSLNPVLLLQPRRVLVLLTGRLEGPAAPGPAPQADLEAQSRGPRGVLLQRHTTEALV